MKKKNLFYVICIAVLVAVAVLGVIYTMVQNGF